MNKILIVLLVLGVGALVYYVLGGNNNILPPEMQLGEEVNFEEVEQALKETKPHTVYGSCNVIAEKSTCVDYVGSMWADNNSAELNCKGVGTFSKNTCPYSELGGCQSSAGTVMEIISWFYEEGPGEFTDESIPYARMACEAVANSNWTMPDAQ